LISGVLNVHDNAELEKKNIPTGKYVKNFSFYQKIGTEKKN
jgi:hypothetical protein